MGALRLWQRLLWKEYRESWLVLALGVALPLLTIPFHRQDDNTGLAGSLAFTSIAVISLLVTLWAADRAHRTGAGRGSTRTLLPITTPARWASTYLLPLLVPILVGAAVGAMISVYAERPAVDMLPGTELFMLANFVLCTALASALSLIPAIIAGALLLFLTFDAEQIADSIPLLAWVLVGSAIAALLWETATLKKRYLPGKIGAVVAVAAAVAVPIVLTKLPGWVPDRPPGPDPKVIGVIGYPSDGSWFIRLGEADSAGLGFRDLRTARELVRDFPTGTQPVAVLDDTHALLAQQRRSERTIRFLLWDVRPGMRESRVLRELRDRRGKVYRSVLDDTTPNSVREVARSGRVSGRLRQCEFYRVSPDGRYVAFGMASHAGSGCDVWMVDLRQERAALALPNMAVQWVVDNDGARWLLPGADSASWAGDGLCLSGMETIRVDLRTLRGTRVPVPDGRRAVR